MKLERSERFRMLQRTENFCQPLADIPSMQIQTSSDKRGVTKVETTLNRFKPVTTIDDAISLEIVTAVTTTGKFRQVESQMN